MAVTIGVLANRTPMNVMIEIVRIVTTLEHRIEGQVDAQHPPSLSQTHPNAKINRCRLILGGMAAMRMIDVNLNTIAAKVILTRAAIILAIPVTVTVLIIITTAIVAIVSTASLVTTIRTVVVMKKRKRNPGGIFSVSHSTRIRIPMPVMTILAVNTIPMPTITTATATVTLVINTITLVV